MMTLSERGMDVLPLNIAEQRENHHDILDERFWALVPKVWDYTELPLAVLYNLYCSVRYVADFAIPGDIVECGVHMGGSIMLIEYALLEGDKVPGRRVFALDTFTGFLRRTEGLDVDLRSGAVVCEPELGVYDYSFHSIDNMKSIGFDRLEIVTGDVLETIPTLDTKKIAILRCDTDTYDTTKFELEQLYSKVSIGGVVIIDDYGYTAGCKAAVDNFIAPRKILLQRINPNVRSWVKVVA
jgi:O-methyltransferase